MAATFRDEEAVELLKFALRNYRSHFGTSALVALMRARAIDDALLAAAAGPRAAAWRPLVPTERADAAAPHPPGWQPATHEAGLVASLVLGSTLPIEVSIIQGLRGVAARVEGEADARMAAAATDRLRRMADLVTEGARAFGNGSPRARAAPATGARESPGLGLAEPDARGLPDWGPLALEELCRRADPPAPAAPAAPAAPSVPRTLEELVRDYDDDGAAYGEQRRDERPRDEPLLPFACAWLVAAADRSMHLTWPEPAADAASRMLERQREEERQNWYAPRVENLGVAAARFAACVSLGRALELLNASHAQGDDLQNLSRAALARVRHLSPDLPSTAASYLRSWAAGLSHQRSSRPWRGPFGVFPYAYSPPPRSLAASVGPPFELMRQAGGGELVAVALEVVSKGFAYNTVSALVAPDHAQAFEGAAIERFKSTPSPRVALGVCLAELGTIPALEALFQELAGDASSADVSEWALTGARPIATQLLMTAIRQANPKVALRAARALAARRDPAAHRRFAELAERASGPLRWVAIEGLSLLGRSAEASRTLRAAFDRATPPEEQLLLDRAADCATTYHDLAWTLELDVRPGHEAALSKCAARLALFWPDDHPDASRAALLDRLIGLLVDDPRRLLAWGTSSDESTRLVRLIRIHLQGVGPRYPELIATLDRLRVPPAPIAGASNSSQRGPSQQADGAPVPRSFDADAGVEASRRQPPLSESACFSVRAPASVPPGASFLVEVFVHSKGARDELAQWSSMPRARDVTVGPRRVASGTTLDVAISIEGVEVEDESAQVLWDGALGALSFWCAMPADALSPTYPGKATFSVGGVAIAKAHFVIDCGPVAGAPREVATEQKVVRSAFASYASPDRVAVLARVQGMRKVVPFLDIFVDVLSLRSGERWADVIRDEIKARDVLLLFWSTAASQSPHVETEWRIALEEKGLESIDPVPLEPPATVPPPAELSALHFNDPLLFVR